MFTARFTRTARHLFAAALAAFSLHALAGIEANQASRADLETVKGIGPGLAGKIVSAREAGAFKDWNDLVTRVGGVGPGNAARFSQAGLTVGGSAFDGKPAEARPAKAAKADKASAEGDKPTRKPRATKAETPAT